MSDRAGEPDVAQCDASGTSVGTLENTSHGINIDSTREVNGASVSETTDVEMP